MKSSLYTDAAVILLKNKTKQNKKPGAQAPPKILMTLRIMTKYFLCLRRSCVTYLLDSFPIHLLFTLPCHPGLQAIPRTSQATLMIPMFCTSCFYYMESLTPRYLKTGISLKVPHTMESFLMPYLKFQNYSSDI